MARHTFTDNDPAYEITEGKNFDYVIRQQLLPGNYSSFELKDVLDSCLKYRSASVVTALGNDVTRFFNIENRSNTIVFRADSNFLKTDEAYNNVTAQLATIKAKAENAALYNAQMKISENNFIQGKIDIISLSLERARRSGAVTSYAEARVSLHNAIILLEMLTNVKIIKGK
jgi:fimbrial isopeptide formation D2 family protein